jgi:xanthine dehydrogenase accessory factor
MALATLVRATGSSYLRPGARMLITPDGETVGLLSGGCIEEEVAVHAQRVIATGEVCVVAFDTRLRFGCSGSIEILIERVDAGFMQALERCFRDRVPFTSITSDECGTRVVDESDADRPDPRALLQTFEPVVQIVVCGDGPDSVPLIELTATLGWDTAVLDEPAMLSQVRWDCRTVAVVKTHHYGRDFVFLQELIRRDLPYIGLIGSRKRKEQLVAALLDLAPDFADRATNRIFGPAGLDLGAASPEEIALSVVAEIQSVLAGGRAGSLRDRTGPLHPRTVMHAPCAERCTA